MKDIRAMDEATEAAVPRRDFLRTAGFSLAAALSGCSRLPVEQAIPHLVPLETVAPGEAVRYATVCKGCPAGCGVLATCVDGRPIKLEGNPDHPVSRGALCAAGQASILGLYDPRRRREPLARGRSTDWGQADREIRDRLDRIVEAGQSVVILTTTRSSPFEDWAIRRFLDRFPQGRRVVYDPVPVTAVTEAHLYTHGVETLPHYQLERAEVIVGFGADFLGTWISPVEFSQAYRDGRTLEASRLRYSYHAQIEAWPTLTGARADLRITADPGAMVRAVLELARLVEGREVPGPDGGDDVDPGSGRTIDGTVPADVVAGLAARLRAARGRSVVLCGIQDLEAQVAVNRINQALGNYGRTLDLAFPAFQRAGSDRDLAWFRAQFEGEQVGAVLAACNPVYDLPFGEELGRRLAAVPLGVSFSPYADETAGVMEFCCPEPHFLEAWGDSEPHARVLALQQPCIRPRGNPRTLAESLAAWSGVPGTDLELLQEFWRESQYPRQVGIDDFDAFWAASLHQGVARVRPERRDPGRFRQDPAGAGTIPGQSPALQPGTMAAKDGAPPAYEVILKGWEAALTPGDGFLLLLREAVAFPDVSHSGNPWLLELPDPLTRLSWGNGIEMGPDLAGRLGVADGDVVRLTLPSGASAEAPVKVMPGIAADCVVLALNYGSAAASALVGLGPRHRGRGVAEGVGGIRASGLVRFEGGRRQLYSVLARLEASGERRPLISTQPHTDPAPSSPLDGTPRDLGLVQTMSMDELLATRPAEPSATIPGLWGRPRPAADPTLEQWGMVIDLGACTGCGACVIACQAENNVPVVGPDEALRRRTMHWLRIDYYQADDGATHFLPVPCQHCAKAPCEVVCPVAATVHGEDGLNVQVYNRCIGTRYCANNCPWKVRAFNWFDYPREPMETLQLNPNVTVRSRGVMEKCTFCVQRIQTARLDARASGAVPADGAIRPACAQTCASRAIVFGNLADPQSEVSKLARSPRSYRLLEELGTEPAVRYLRRVVVREGEDT